MPTVKTPGVYVVEKNAFPNSVVQVATAVPAFIGYTATAMAENKSLHMMPFRLSTMTEFEAHYGGAPHVEFSIQEGEGSNGDNTLPSAISLSNDRTNNNVRWSLTQSGVDYCLYAAMRLFFQNGGGACYIVSIGQYDGQKAADQKISSSAMMAGIKTLIKEPEPTLLVIPETTRLPEKMSISVQQAMLAHCGFTMRNRFALLDIHKGYLELQDASGVEPIKNFRNTLGDNQLDFGAAYYPWVESTAFTNREFTFQNIVNREAFAALLVNSIQLDNAALTVRQKKEIALIISPQLLPSNEDSQDYAAEHVPKPQSIVLDIDIADDGFEFLTPDSESNGPLIEVAIDKTSATVGKAGNWAWELETKTISFTPISYFRGEVAIDYQVKQTTDEEFRKYTAEVYIDGPTVEELDKRLREICPLYTQIMDAITVRQNTVSPGALMAGIYTMVDNSRGVWKAPANVSLNSVVAPLVNISDYEQEELNVSAQGKSINAIRPFVGEGTLVWGARTLDGNSLDWRYINVRRTMILIEESIRLALNAYVFEPNNANTWVTVKSMIDNFLNSIWKQGGLAGAVPEDAFSVHVGPDVSTTPNDIKEDIMSVTVRVAISRPAEYIETKFNQQMQSS